MRSVASQLLIVGLFFCGLPTCVVAEETNRTVKINEILFDALADDAGKEWIELCNTGSKAVDLNGWQLTSRDGLIATLPACRLPAGGFLLVKFGSGTNDIDFSDNAGTCFVVGSTAVLSDSYDEIGLFRGKPSAATIEDFVAYSRNNVREMGSTYRVAVAASIWPVLAVVRQADFVEAGSSLGRNSGVEDTNTPGDWWWGGGLDAITPTPGAANAHPLAYELCALTSPLVLPALLGQVTPLQQKKIDLLKKVLKQIHSKHMDLISDLGDSLIGKKLEMRQSGKGELVVGKLRFIFRTGLVHPSHRNKTVGALTEPPTKRGGEIKIYLNYDELNSEWKMKDAVLHEIGHAAQFQHAQSGFWRETGNLNSKGTRTQAVKVHECRCYVSNLRLLCRFKVTGEFHKKYTDPKTKKEHKDHTQEINDRIIYKAKQLSYFLGLASKDLVGFLENPVTRAQFGDHLRNGLQSDRERALQLLAIAIKLENEKKEKNKKTATVTQINRIANAIRQWNIFCLNEHRIEEKDIFAFVNRLLATDLKVLLEAVGKPLKPIQVAGGPGKSAKPAPQPMPQTSKETAAAKRARIAAIKKHAKVLKAKEIILINKRNALRQTVTALKKHLVTYSGPRREHYQKELLKKQEELKQAEDKVAAAKEALEDYTKQHKTELALTPTGNDQRLARIPVVKEPSALFVSDLGGQGCAIYEELLSLGDLVEITAFGKALPAPLAGELTTDDILANADLAMISALSSETAKTINELRDYLTTVRQQLQTAGNDPGAIGKVLDDLVAKPAPIDPAIAKYLRNPQEFRAQVFHAFAPAIVTRLANAELAGASVTKGSAVVDATSGTAVVGLSIKIDLPGAQPAGSSNAKVIKTDAEGKFAVQGTGVATLTISGPDVVSQEQEVRLSEAPFNWTADTWNELEEDQQWQITDSLDALYLRLSEGFARPEDLPEDAAERKAAATKIAETIRRTYQQTAARRSVVSEGVLKAFATPETFSPVATLLSEQGTTAAFKPLLVEHRQGEQVPAGQPMPKPFRAAALPVQPKLDAIAVELEQPAANLDLTDSLVKAVQGAAPANSTVQVKKIRSQAMTLPDGLGGTSTIQILEVSVVSPNGAPRKADPVQLQKNLDELADGNDQIRFAEVSLPREAEVGPPKDPHYTSRGSWGKKYYDQWALRRVSLQQGKTEWPTVPKEIKPQNQCIVAVIGSGVDWTHPELLGQMWQNSSEDPYNGMDDDGNGYVDDQFGYNFRDNNFKVLDKGGHDTHVAGVIAARWNQQGIAGINPQAKIMALKIANYLGQANSVDISRAIFYAVDQGAQVINISYGGGQPSRIEQRAIDYAASNNVLVVVAAGNKASDASKYALASCRGVLTVAGTTVEDTRAPFSNWGQAVDLSAPAMDVLALRARDTDFLVYTGENPDYQGGSAVVGKSQDLYRASGTSFAAPLVAGAASLLRSSRPELSAQQVKQMLIMSAHDVETPGWDQFTGSGVLSIQQAVTADPDYFLFARISEVKAVRKENKVSIQVLGQASGSSLAKYQLQVGFGASPADGDWMTVSTGDKAVPDGQLGTLPLTRFNRKGAWTIRLLVTDKQGKSRQARATLNLN